MKTDDSLRCNYSYLKSLVGYRYETDTEIVNDASRIDVEIRNIEVLLSNGVNIFPDSQESMFDAAFGVYKSYLGSVARDTHREVVPVFASFSRFFDFDDYYADTMIVSINLFILR